MNKLLVKGGKVLISDPLRNEKDDKEIIDAFMQVKKDGHIRFYSLDELDKLFLNHGFTKAKQVITDMKFPFAKRSEYINVGNTVFVKM